MLGIFLWMFISKLKDSIWCYMINYWPNRFYNNKILLVFISIILKFTFFIIINYNNYNMSYGVSISNFNAYPVAGGSLRDGAPWPWGPYVLHTQHTDNCGTVFNALLFMLVVIKMKILLKYLQSFFYKKVYIILLYLNIMTESIVFAWTFYVCWYKHFTGLVLVLVNVIFINR